MKRMLGAALALMMSVGLAAAPASAESAPVSDAAVDNGPGYDARGDLLTGSARYADGVFGVAAITRQYENPASYNWQKYYTGILWNVVTPAATYTVNLAYVNAAGRVEGWLLDSNANTVCDGELTYGDLQPGGGYIVEFPASCIGHPAWVQTRAFMAYHTGYSDSYDFAPDSPSYGPVISETITPQQPAPQPQPEPQSQPDPIVTTASAHSGYWMVTDDGTVFNFGDAQNYGSELAATVKRVDVKPTPSGKGYWILAESGALHNKGDAKWLGSALNALGLGEKAAALSSTPSGNGYWIFTNRGRVLNFGDAQHFGDMAGVPLSGAVLGAAATPSGNGYWMVASDGGIFSFGDAKFSGSMGGQSLNKPVMAMAPDPDGSGYWLVASDGGIFAFDSGFFGSMGGAPLNKPISGMVPAPGGYMMVGSDGGIFAFGNVQYHGSLGATPPARPVVAVALMP